MVATGERSGSQTDRDQPLPTSRQEAIERRRMARYLRKRRRENMTRAELIGEIKRRMREVVQRMIRMYRLHDAPDDSLIHFYDYWSLRRMGVDALSASIRATSDRDEAGNRIVLEPHETPMWRWWLGINWMVRLQLSGGGVFILRGLRMPKEHRQYAAEITNPAFQVDAQPVDDDTLLSRLQIENA